MNVELFEAGYACMVGVAPNVTLSVEALWSEGASDGVRANGSRGHAVVGATNDRRILTIMDTTQAGFGARRERRASSLSPGLLDVRPRLRKVSC
jgi:hypothetical protein